MAIPRVDGRVVSIVAALVAVAFITFARSSTTVLIVLAVAILAVAAYGAHRWPLQTLVAATIATLADLQILPRLLPEGVSPEPIGASEPMLAVVGLVITVDALRRRAFVDALRDPVLPLTVLFVVLAVVSAVVNATPPVVALLGIVMTVDAVAIFFVARMVPVDERAVGAAIAAAVGAAAAASAFGIAQIVVDPHLFGFFSFEGEFGEGWRITSFLGNPNMVAAVLGLMLPYALYGSLHLETGRWRWAARVVLVVMVWALLLTFSRGAWLGVGLGVLIGAVLVDWRSLLVLVAALAIAWGAMTVMPRYLVSDGQDGEGRPSPPPSVIDTSADRFGNLRDETDTRARFVREGLPIVMDNLALGVGPGRYGGAAATIIESPVYDEYGTSTLGFRTVHNFWLHLLGESGVAGTAVFLTMLAGLLIRFVREAHRATGLRFVIVAGAATMLLVAGFHSLAEMIFEGNMPVLLVWMVFGLASMLAPMTPLFGGRRAGI